MNLVENHQAILVSGQVQLCLAQLGPIRREFQIQVDGPMGQLIRESQRQCGLTRLARAKKRYGREPGRSSRRRGVMRR